MARATRRWVTIAGACLAVLALVAAFYFFSAGVLLESGCRMKNEAACVSLALTLRASFWLAVVGIVVASLTGVRVVLRARR